MNKNGLSILLILLFIFCMTLVYSSGNSVPTENSKTLSILSYVNNDTISYKTFKTDSGWGYDIFINGKLYIHQPNIPAVIGNNGFIKEEYAAKTALFVIEKIRKHILPPTVNAHELDSIKVIN
jgi:hypothetical protein